MQGFPTITVEDKTVNIVEKIQFHGTELYRDTANNYYTMNPSFGKLEPFEMEAGVEADEADPELVLPDADLRNEAGPLTDEQLEEIEQIGHDVDTPEDTPLGLEDDIAGESFDGEDDEAPEAA